MVYCFCSLHNLSYSAWVPIQHTNKCTWFSPNPYLTIIRNLLPAISKTTRQEPLPNKSAVGNESLISPGKLQSASFIFVSHSLKELLLPACSAIKFLIVFSFIKCTFRSYRKYTKSLQKVKLSTQFWLNVILRRTVWSAKHELISHRVGRAY